MRVACIILSTTVLLSALPHAMGQTLEQFFTIYNMTRNHLDDDPALARRLVRMAFHDAMGGVDAHIDLNNSEHDGLGRTVRLLNRFWSENTGTPMMDRNSTQRSDDRGERMDANNTQQGGGRGGIRDGGRMRNGTDSVLGVSLEGLTKADFFSWVYISAFYSTCRGHVPWVPLRFGRTAFDDAQVEDTPPNSEFGSGDHAANLAYFEDHFGFNEGQVAVLMGAHTLGGASRRNSGFVGDWTSSSGTFNSDYYENLVFPAGRGGWEQIQVVNSTKFEWRWGCNNRCRDLMLNVDMNLFYVLDDYYVGDNGEVHLPKPLPESAPPGLCDDPGHVFAECFPQRTGSATHAVVSLFEDGNNELFLDNFAMVFGKMVARVKDEAALGYVAPPADWPAGIRRGGRRRGRDGQGPAGDRNGCPTVADMEMDEIGFENVIDEDIDDIDGFVIARDGDLTDDDIMMDDQLAENEVATARGGIGNNDGFPGNRQLRATSL